VSRGAEGARTRLERLLYLIPAAQRPEGVRISELCRILEVAPRTLQRDIQLLTEREMNLTAGTPGSLQVEWQPGQDRLRIWTPGPFRRPPRLSRAEAAAVVLGIRSRAAAPGELDEERFHRVLERIHGILMESAPESAEPPPVFDASLSEPDVEFRDLALDAMAQGRALDLDYLKPEAEAPEYRRLAPYATVHAEGSWYLLGRDPDADGMRAFRMDRILRIAITDERFQVPEDFDPQDYAREARLFFQGPDEAPPEPVGVVYSPRIARWIEERYPGESLADGSYRVVHPVVNRDWLIRHVLGYGGEARAEGEAAKWIREALQA